MVDTSTCLDLFDPPFVPQVGQYLQKRVIVNVDVVENDGMVDLAGLFDELVYHGFFLLVLPVLHT
jgi:hypothetical protein